MIALLPIRTRFSVPLSFNVHIDPCLWQNEALRGTLASRRDWFARPSLLGSDFHRFRQKVQNLGPGTQFSSGSQSHKLIWVPGWNWMKKEKIKWNIGQTLRRLDVGSIIFLIVYISKKRWYLILITDEIPEMSFVFYTTYHQIRFMFFFMIE